MIATTRRVSYLRQSRTGTTLAVADFSPDGQGMFAERESQENRWYPFTPTQRERSLVECLSLEEPDRRFGTPICIDAFEYH